MYDAMYVTMYLLTKSSCLLPGILDLPNDVCFLCLRLKRQRFFVFPSVVNFSKEKYPDDFNDKWTLKKSYVYGFVPCTRYTNNDDHLTLFQVL